MAFFNHMQGKDGLSRRLARLAPSLVKDQLRAEQSRLFYVLAFILPIWLMTLVFALLGLFPFGQETIMSGDYTLQYMPIYRALGHVFGSFDLGALFWSWYKGLGGVMAPVWGFNSLSPLSLLIGLTPAAYLNWSVFLVTVMRHGLAGLTFFIFLKQRYVRGRDNQLLALLIALAYSLNGFLVVNQVNPNFLDNLILLPLLLLGVEKILDGQKSLGYPLILAVMIITQFYTAYMAAIFVVFYAAYYAFSQEQPLIHSLTALIRLLLYSLLGLTLSAIWLLPVFYALLDTKAAAGGSTAWSFDFLYNPLDLLLKFIPGAASGEEWGDAKSLPNIYVGVISFIGLVNFFLTRTISRRQKLVTLLVLAALLLAFANTATIRLWHMGQLPVGFYYRNAWVLSTFLLVLTYQALARWQQWQPLQAGLTLTLALASATYAYGLRASFSYDLVDGSQLLLWLLLVGLILLSLCYRRLGRWSLFLVLVLTLFDLGLNAKETIARNLWFTPASRLETEAVREALYQQISLPQASLDRLEQSSSSSWNDSLTYGYYGVTHFSSSIEYQTLEFLGQLGLPTSTALAVYSGGTPLTDALLNLRYYLDSGTWTYGSRAYNPSYYQTVQNLGQSQVLENPYVLGLGYSGSAPLFTENLSKDDPIANQNAIYMKLFADNQPILTALASGEVSISYDNLLADGQLLKRQSSQRPGLVRISFKPGDNQSYYLYAPNIKSHNIGAVTMTLNDQVYKVFDRFRYPQLWSLVSQASGQEQVLELRLTDDSSLDLTDLAIYRFDDERFKAGFASQQVASWQPSQLTSTKVTGAIHQPAGQDYLLTSIPYNKGWQVKVDGQRVAGQAAWQAMLAFELSPGQHEIELSYQPPGLLIGSLLSASALVILLALAVSDPRKKQAVGQ